MYNTAILYSTQDKEVLCAAGTKDMKLSMHMLEYWFRDYHPVATIISGQRTITNARLFTDILDPDPNCLYVGQNKDFFPESTSDEILLMHQKDVLSIKFSELNRIFNMVLCAFDYFNKMEAQMIEATVHDSPEQGIRLSLSKWHFSGILFYRRICHWWTDYLQSFPRLQTRCFSTTFLTALMFPVPKYICGKLTIFQKITIIILLCCIQIPIFCCHP